MSDVIHLQEPVEWNPGQQNVSKEFDQREKAINDPVRQPFCVIIFVCRLNCLHPTRTTEPLICTEWAKKAGPLCLFPNCLHKFSGECVSERILV